MAQTKAQLLGPVVGDVTIDVNTLSLDAENNKVGIGTTEADLRLHVNGVNGLPSSSGSTPTGHLTLRNKAGSSSHGMFMGISNAAPWGSWIQAQDASNNATNYPLLLNPNGGNIGIGTDNPLDKLSIHTAPNALVFGAKDTTRGNHIFQLLANNPAGDGELRLYKSSATGTHEKTVEIKSTGNSYFTGGNVGIGTDNPEEDLHIASNSPYILLDDIDNSRKWRLKGTAWFSIEDTTVGEDRLRIDSSGRVLLGATTEGEANADDLTVATSGHTGMTIRSGTANRGNIYFSDGTSGDAEYRGYVTYDHDGDKFKFGTANADRLVILANGKVGINQGTPTAFLHTKSGANDGTVVSTFEGATNNKLDIKFISTGPAINVTAGDPLVFEMSGTEKLRIDSNNTVHIGKRDGNQNVTHFGTSRVSICGPDPVATSVSKAGSYLAIGNNESELNGVYPITFGYTNNTNSHQPAYIAYKTTNSGGAEYGDLLFGTRNVTSDTEPTERLRITSAGQVLVGNYATHSSIHGNLEVNGNDGINISNATRTGTNGAQWRLIPNSGGSNTNAATNLRLYEGAGGVEVLNIQKTGQVMIAHNELISHPNMDDLQIGDANGNRGLTICSGSSGFGSVCFGDSSDGSGNDRYRGFVEYYHGDDSLRLGTESSERFRIVKTTASVASTGTGAYGCGVVGINETDPAGDALALAVHAPYGMEDPRPLVYMKRSHGIGGGSATDETVLHIDGTASYNSAGVIYGIKVNTKHNLNGSHYSGHFVNDGSQYAANNTSAVYVETHKKDTNGGGAVIALHANGRITTGVSNTGYAIAGLFETGNNINGRPIVCKQGYTANTYVNQIEFTKNNGSSILVVGSIKSNNSATQYNTSSDYRLKENVVSLTGAIDRLKQLQPKRFNFIGEEETIDGFIAHEVSSTAPYAVSGEKDAMKTELVMSEDGKEQFDENGEIISREVIDPQSVDYSKLSTLTIAALQEAIGEIETLKQRLTDAGL